MEIDKISCFMYATATDMVKHSIMNTKQAAQELGRRGGKQTLANKGLDHYRKLAEQTNEKKRLKKLSTSHVDTQAVAE